MQPLLLLLPCAEPQVQHTGRRAGNLVGRQPCEPHLAALLVHHNRLPGYREVAVVSVAVGRARQGQHHRLLLLRLLLLLLLPLLQPPPQALSSAAGWRLLGRHCRPLLLRRRLPFNCIARNVCSVCRSREGQR